ncbi:STAS domain-containing protein [Actinomadura sp. LD22]|uniref:STAS domain-containing protein n=1 Tax=Actinomadura physcomitrii TaxID=2650748 RepID=A0A6I4MK47_9ACTN|nr:STAS domain-containing protein [Actinomadura physcomitrii]MWA02616.1 STAS domain-containing protein [Actinomadura physcomitrii]
MRGARASMACAASRTRSSANRPPIGSPSATAEAREGVTILMMKGQLVAGTVVDAEARILTTTVLSARPLSLVLDLTGVDAIDQHGISLLTKARFTVCAARGALRLVAPPGGAVHPVLNRYLRRITVPRLDDVPPDFGAREPTGIR